VGSEGRRLSHSRTQLNIQELQTIAQHRLTREGLSDVRNVSPPLKEIYQFLDREDLRPNMIVPPLHK